MVIDNGKAPGQRGQGQSEGKQSSISTLSHNATCVFFDANDVNHLVTLGGKQLRREVHSAELHVFKQRMFTDTPYENSSDGWPWTDWEKACRLALTVARSLEISSRPSPTHGQHTRVDAAEIKSRIDIVTIIERYVQLRKSGRNLNGLCPFHSEKHGSFYVYPEQQTWRCFGACGTGGDVIAFIMRAENTDFRGALAFLERES